jgi:hypothetical protein
VRLEWTVFNVPRPALGLTVTRAQCSLQWSGLTNVTYDVQAATNLHSTWATLGKVASASTNFAFTVPTGNAVQFYRLIVP